MSEAKHRPEAGAVVRSVARHAWGLDFRGKSRLVSKLPLRGLGVFSLPWGQLALDLEDRIQRHMAFGTYERQEVRVVRRFVGTGATVVDIGAHVGYFTTLMAWLVGTEGRVIAMEPDPQNCTQLRDNVRRNGARRVEVIEAAASDSDGSLPFHSGPKGETGWGTLRGTPERQAHAVTARRLDSLLLDRGVRAVDFVKVDAEGWEPYVMAGLELMLAQSPGPVILAEVSPTLLSSTGHSGNDLCIYLSQFGYVRRLIRGRAGTFRHNSVFVKTDTANVIRW